MTLQSMHTRLLVSDFKACFLFYRDVLGFTANFGDENDVYADFSSGNAALALFQRELMAQAVGGADRPSDAECQDRVALVLGVDNVDESYAQLQGKGVVFITAPADRPDWGIRTAHFRDPDGNLLEINSSLHS